jgi:chaperone required for assembly of F1-ATPase
MPDSRDLPPAAPPDPVAMARRDQQASLPKRFYTQATVERRDGLSVLLLDGRPAMTPKRRRLAHASAQAMACVAAEWRAQGERIDPTTMPATRLVNVALDAVADAMGEVADDIVRYAGSDLVCYRAEAPESLVAAESAAWDPALAYAREKLGARFTLAGGIVFRAQPTAAVDAVARRVAAIADPLVLAATHAMTTLTGSALLALAVLDGALSPEAAWAAAHVGEDHQMRLWGTDAEALARRARRRQEMAAAAALARPATAPTAD